LLSVAAILLIR